MLVKAVKSYRANLQESRKANKKLLVAYTALEQKHQALKTQVKEEAGEEEGEGGAAMARRRGFMQLACEKGIGFEVALVVRRLA